MRSPRELRPAPMRRVGIVAPTPRVRRVLVEVADRGAFEPDTRRDDAPGPIATLADRVAAGADPVDPVLAVDPVDPDRLAADGAADLLLGEASLEARRAAAERRGRCTILPGWMRAADVDDLRSTVEPFGGAVVELPGRPGLAPPTAYSEGRAGAAFRPLVTTYGTVPYVDVDPTLFAAFAYVLMFGIMFGDVAHGLAIVALGAVALAARRGRLTALRPVAWFLVAAGVAATGFGLLYGEAFGPTGLVPTLWVRPLDEPETFLLAGLLVGVVLLAGTFVLSIVNRWREGGPRLAVYDATGIAGALLLAGVAAAIVALAASSSTWWWIAGALVAGGALLVFGGLLVRSGSGSSGLAEAVVELFDTLLRLGSNVVSFTRLAAFGLTHAVITEVVWDGSVALWDVAGPLAVAASGVLFVAGNLAAFALGALVAGVQALRLEYYEMFSRLFAGSGRPFSPWHIPVRRTEST